MLEIYSPVVDKLPQNGFQTCFACDIHVGCSLLFSKPYQPSIVFGFKEQKRTYLQPQSAWFYEYHVLDLQQHVGVSDKLEFHQQKWIKMVVPLKFPFKFELLTIGFPIKVTIFAQALESQLAAAQASQQLAKPTEQTWVMTRGWFIAAPKHGKKPPQKPWFRRGCTPFWVLGMLHFLGEWDYWRD